MTVPTTTKAEAYRKRLSWYLKQLTPRTYWTTYGQIIENADGTHGEGGEHFVIWKMWLGRCYDVIDVPVAGAVATIGTARAASPPLPPSMTTACSKPRNSWRTNETAT